MRNQKSDFVCEDKTRIFLSLGIFLLSRPAFNNAVMRKDREECPEEASVVESEGETLDIFAVELWLDGNLQLVAAIDLRPFQRSNREDRIV